MLQKMTRKESRISIIPLLFVLYTGGLIALNTWYVYLQVKVNDYLAFNGLTQDDPTGSWVLTSLSEADRIYEMEQLIVDVRKCIFYFCIIFLIGSILLFFKKHSFGFSLYVFLSAYILGNGLNFGATRLGYIYPSEFNFQFNFLEVYAIPFFIALFGVHFCKRFVLKREWQ